MSIEDGSALPLYLRPADPMCAPILSHNARSSNVVLKITVPRRSGRKRKRGSRDPYTFQRPEDDQKTREPAFPSGPDFLRSQSRLDNPTMLQRTLRDNIGMYQIEAVGFIEQTHRYRGMLKYAVKLHLAKAPIGMADFHQSTTSDPFISKFRDSVLQGDCKALSPLYLVFI